jgi:membrane peptidoglycan carboxypeptidase
VCLVTAILLVCAGITYAQLTTGLPPIEEFSVLMNPTNGILLQPTRFYDRSGQNLLFTLENPGISRRFLPIDAEQAESISPALVKFTIALYQPDFWESPGFSWHNLASPKPQTLAEQLAENLVLSQQPPDLKHAVQLRLLGAQLVSTYGHARVLEWYLNSQYYGHMAIGADSAARLYLGKPASQLNEAEAALLIAASQTPALNPIDSPTAALERQQEVLAQLIAVGAITAEDSSQVLKTSLKFQDAPPYSPGTAAAFSRLVLEQLSQRIDRQRLEMGGLRITTTLDSSLQTQLACGVRAQLLRLEGQPIDETVSQSCETARLLPTLVQSGDQRLSPELMGSGLVYDIQSGQVLAYLGKSTILEEKTDLSGYQPGSLLTPFIAAAGFTRGYSPSSLTWDLPSSLPVSQTIQKNPDGKFHGPQSLRSALANDYLSPFAQIMTQMGSSNVWRLVTPMGFSHLAQDTDPISLLYSGGEVSLVDVAHAYSVFATGGTQSGLRFGQGQELQPLLVLKIDGLETSAETSLETRSVLSPQLTYLVHDILSDDNARRPSLGFPNPLMIGRPSAAKIGQTTHQDQVWTVGYTPQLMAITWLGLPTGTPSKPINIASNYKLNVKMAAGLWHAIMQYSTRNYAIEGWSQPPGISTIEVCTPSGQLPTHICPNTVNEVFLEGSEPRMADTLYRVYPIDRETGLLATVFTPLDLVEERVFMVLPPEALYWAQSNDVEIPPSAYDSIQAPAIFPDFHIALPAMYTMVKGSIPISGSAGGTNFKLYRLQVGEGLNPLNWLQIGTDHTIAVRDGVLETWDTSQLGDGLYALRLLVQYQNQQIKTAIIQVTVDNTPPQLSIEYPLQDEIIQMNSQGRVTLPISLEDNIGIQQVVWLVDGTQVCERTVSPYICSWLGSTGQHILEVIATDLAGNISKTATVTFTLK